MGATPYPLWVSVKPYGTFVTFMQAHPEVNAGHWRDKRIFPTGGCASSWFQIPWGLGQSPKATDRKSDVPVPA